MLTTIIAFLLVLSVLVLIHELGHFVIAKLLGVKVEEFGFGFPPRAWGKKFGETIYSINWLPIGGFVRLFGEDSAGGGQVGSVSDEALHAKGKNLTRAFFARPVWQRFSIVFAGVFMNFVLAVGIWTYLSSAQGIPAPGKDVIVAGIAPNSPAQKAGLKSGEVILSVDNQAVVSSEQLISYTKKHVGEQVTLKVKNSESHVQIIQLTPRVHYPSNEGAMGVAISQDIVYQRYPWYQAPIVGFKESVSQLSQMVGMLGQIATQLVVAHQVPQGLAGPVGIAQLTGEVVQVGPYAVLSLVALLSLNLAVLNVLPIPALDGGRLFFILIEGITRHKVSPKIEGYAHAAGMVFLLALIAFITFHDLLRIFSGQPLIPR